MNFLLLGLGEEGLAGFSEAGGSENFGELRNGQVFHALDDDTLVNTAGMFFSSGRV